MLLRSCFVAMMVILVEGNSIAQSNDIVYPFASGNARKEQYKYLVDTAIQQYLAEPLNEETEGMWNEAFWALELLLYKNDFSKQKLQEAWKLAGNLSEYFQKNLLEATYTLYVTEFTVPVQQLLQSTTSPTVFIRCAEYLLRAGANQYKPAVLQRLNSFFRDEQHTGIKVLRQRLDQWDAPVQSPPLKDIFSPSFLKGETVIYSLQRTNRDYAGLVIIRGPDGRFVTNKAGTLFSTSQLARAITDYPFYITNGNTPQGIFRWTGFEMSKIGYIGPTPNLQLKMPYEVPPSVFFADSGLVDAPWQKELYATMLPASWNNHEGMFESFYAGAMGRYDIIMHGTTIDPSFYKGQTYYPQTPSLGCLCSYEAWDNNGRRVKSHQQQIDDALDSIGSNYGYVVVINIDDAQKAVTPGEIMQYLPASY